MEKLGFKPIFAAVLKRRAIHSPPNQKNEPQGDIGVLKSEM